MWRRALLPINDLYPISTGGDLEITVTKANGRVHGFTVPYSSVPVLQREGRVRYGLTAGRYRSSSHSYEDPSVCAGHPAVGVATQCHLVWRDAALRQLSLAGAGGRDEHGGWGAMSADVTQADSVLADGSRHQGQSVRFLSGRSLVSTGTTLQLAGYRFSTQGVHTLEETALKRMSGWMDDTLTVDAAGRPLEQNWTNHYSLYNNKRDRLQASISQRLGDLGSLYMTGSRQTFWQLKALVIASVGRLGLGAEKNGRDGAEHR